MYVIVILDRNETVSLFISSWKRFDWEFKSKDSRKEKNSKILY